MNRREAIEERQVWRRIISTLLALADLAERSSMSSMPIRCLVLWLLRPAEAVARDFVTETANEFGIQVFLPASHEGVPFAENRTDDALRLARSFRILAATLGSLAVLTLEPGPASFHAGSTRRRSACRCRPAFANRNRFIGRLGFARQAYDDSS